MSTADKKYFWIALNGSSCAASPTALSARVQVVPRPQNLIGFPTRHEQLAAQKICIESPIPEVRRFMKGLLTHPDLLIKVYDNPEPVFPGMQTAWIEAR
jgi:hypothetical protein